VLLAAILTGTFLGGCSLMPEKQVVTVPTITSTQIPTVARPKPVQLSDTRVYVVNASNYNDFVKEFSAENGELAYVALSMKDYENLALNIAELRRYIDQQGEIIVYYEKAVTEPKETTK
jgi:hypothetical protein